MEVVEWFDQNVGPIEEGVTWFWSVKVYFDEELSKEICEDGVEIFKDDPEVWTLATLRWT